MSLRSACSGVTGSASEAIAGAATRSHATVRVVVQALHPPTARPPRRCVRLRRCHHSTRELILVGSRATLRRELIASPRTQAMHRWQTAIHAVLVTARLTTCTLCSVQALFRGATSGTTTRAPPRRNATHDRLRGGGHAVHQGRRRARRARSGADALAGRVHRRRCAPRSPARYAYITPRYPTACPPPWEVHADGLCAPRVQRRCSSRTRACSRRTTH